MRVAAFFLGTLFCASLLAQTFPLRPIRLIVPFSEGSATDSIARIVAQKMGESIGQPVLVENRAGAAGAVGSNAVAKSPADGYTLLLGTTSTHALGPALNPRLPYRLDDFAPVTLVATFPQVLVAHPATAGTLADLVALLARPGRHSFGSPGERSPQHLTGELFKLATQAQMQHVAYSASAPMLDDLAAGRLTFAFDQLGAVMPGLQAGRMRALGVSSLERNPALPDVPAIAEALPGFEATAWVGLFAPARTAPEITSRLQGEVRRIVQLSEVAQRIKELGASPASLAPEAFATFVAKDAEKWRGAVNAAGIKVEQ